MAAGVNFYAMTVVQGFEKRGHRFIDAAPENARRCFQHAHPKTCLAQAGGGFQANVTGADHHRRASLWQVGTQSVGVRQIAQVVHPLERRALDIQAA
ncbi:hypothetical protein ABMA08_17010 [Pseudomonas yamanorum]